MPCMFARLGHDPFTSDVQVSSTEIVTGIDFGAAAVDVENDVDSHVAPPIVSAREPWPTGAVKAGGKW